ncbi:hypothetical protein VFPPC_16416 [Pochonia chlamydosporia 170]|uniref:Uncharacterized protein n=1 Tax=Pochonia chlamydosporia 170 TaxID=1380566 RepID=A0A179FCK3_METCM|nr:hypothetical protein VFPPC_16416 [Pochonia chlamydosporia 170]OAQ63030.1 hypothetical protein VFPPC_16416 [Pochonia chlamydosporia 170]
MHVGEKTGYPSSRRNRRSGETLVRRNGWMDQLGLTMETVLWTMQSRQGWMGITRRERWQWGGRNWFPEHERVLLRLLATERGENSTLKLEEVSVSGAFWIF